MGRHDGDALNIPKTSQNPLNYFLDTTFFLRVFLMERQSAHLTYHKAEALDALQYNVYNKRPEYMARARARAQANNIRL